MADLYQMWDVGEEDLLTPTKDRLWSVMDALIRLGGKLHSSHCLELRDCEYRYPPRSCSVVLRISLPVGHREAFEALTGLRLSLPPRVGVSGGEK